MSGKSVGRDNGVSARLQQMLCCGFFTRARNDLQVRIQTTRCEHNIKVGGISRSRGNESDRSIYASLPKGALFGGVTFEVEPLLLELFESVMLCFDDRKCRRPPRQLSRGAQSHTTCSTDDVVP